MIMGAACGGGGRSAESGGSPSSVEASCAAGSSSPAAEGVAPAIGSGTPEAEHDEARASKKPRRVQQHGQGTAAHKAEGRAVTPDDVAGRGLAKESIVPAPSPPRSPSPAPYPDARGTTNPREASVEAHVAPTAASPSPSPSPPPPSPFCIRAELYFDYVVRAPEATGLAAEEPMTAEQALEMQNERPNFLQY
eukprot:CAMPEP_0206249844 /NCGR_PEP_ID=MMETSP0047_2-20121206/21133_1 /ASSEMBLY_ACC=CAM_ASM_000192 /TAXON_ID=195065 /ORGANISM="Chroomonas mesostigmatica_cf, Strain CCMP1168" /LENGTH=192 /DNA_ID=CAMNT_0053675609 /DNA_START=95 /DNA_END=673 /DNA_ORIENTATION=+